MSCKDCKGRMQLKADISWSSDAPASPLLKLGSPRSPHTQAIFPGYCSSPHSHNGSILSDVSIRLTPLGIKLLGGNSEYNTRIGWIEIYFSQRHGSSTALIAGLLVMFSLLLFRRWLVSQMLPHYFCLNRSIIGNGKDLGPAGQSSSPTDHWMVTQWPFKYFVISRLIYMQFYIAIAFIQDSSITQIF